MTVVRPTTLTPGPQGPAGPAGPPGAAGPTNIASASVIGATRLSVDPVDPATPIAVGDNDPRIADRVSLAPATTARNIIQATDPAASPLTVRTAAGATTLAQQWQNSAGGLLAGVDQFGNVLTSSVKTPALLTRMILNTNGHLQGNVLMQQGAPGNRALVLQAAASPTVNLLEFQDSAGAIKGSINAFAGATLAGINSVGGHTFTGGGTSVVQASSSAAATIPMIAKGTVSQNGSLQEWQDSAGAMVARLTPAGALNLMSQFSVEASFVPAGVAAFFNSGSPTNVPILARGATAQSSDMQQWQTNAPATLAKVTSAGLITGPIVAQPLAAAAVPLKVQQFDTTNDTVQFASSTGGVFSKIRSDGGYEMQAVAANFGNFVPGSGAIGDKISLWGNGTAGQSYGIGVQGGTMVLYAGTGGGIGIRNASTVAGAQLSTGVEAIRLQTSGVTSITNIVGGADPSAVAGQGQLYVLGGALKYRGASGTITTIAPA